MKKTIRTKDKNGNTMFINIELCRTNHVYWSITADVYEKGKRIINKNLIHCGCVHDEILKAKPEFKIFVNLHLSDDNGIPMNAIENGFYFYEIMYGIAKYHIPEVGDYEKYRNVLMNHLRISESSVDKLIRSMEGKTEREAKVIFSSYCGSLLDIWKMQSEEAKVMLNNL